MGKKKTTKKKFSIKDFSPRKILKMICDFATRD
jgi:hypothetical protein